MPNPSDPEPYPFGPAGQAETDRPTSAHRHPSARVVRGYPPIAGFEFLGELRRGRGGAVYKARESASGRTVVVEVLPPTGTSPHPAVTAARAILSANHPNLVRVVGAGEAGGQPYVAVEYLGGGTLAGRVRAKGPLPPSEAAAVVATVARGVQAAHDAGVAGLVLTTSGVRFDDRGTPKVIDLGLHTHNGGGPADKQAADVRAVGAVLYEAITGRPPFRGSSGDLVQRLAGRPAPLVRSVGPAVPKALESICFRCLSPDPRARYATAAAAADDLERFLSGHPLFEGPAVTPPAGRRPGQSRRAARRVGTALLLAGGGVGGLLVAGMHPGGRPDASDTRADAAGGLTPPQVHRSPAAAAPKAPSAADAPPPAAAREPARDPQPADPAPPVSPAALDTLPPRTPAPLATPSPAPAPAETTDPAAKAEPKMMDGGPDPLLPPVLPPESPNSTSRSSPLAGAARWVPKVNVYPVRGGTGGAAAGKRKVGFFNYTGRDLDMLVDGKPLKLPAKHYIQVEVPAEFGYRVGAAAAETLTVPAGSAGLEVVFRE